MDIQAINLNNIRNYFDVILEIVNLQNGFGCCSGVVTCREKCLTWPILFKFCSTQLQALSVWHVCDCYPIHVIICGCEWYKLNFFLSDSGAGCKIFKMKRWFPKYSLTFGHIPYFKHMRQVGSTVTSGTREVGIKYSKIRYP